MFESVLSFFDNILHKIDYDQAMMLKNILIFIAGLLLGIVSMSLLGSFALMKNKSRKRDKNLTVASAVKILDGNNEEHLVFNVTSFTQAFYYIFASVCHAFNPKFKVLYRNKKRELIFFVSFCTVMSVLVFVAVNGIAHIVKQDSDWQRHDRIHMYINHENDYIIPE